MPQRGGPGAVNLGKSAAIAGHRGEAFVLHLGPPGVKNKPAEAGLFVDLFNYGSN